MNKSKKPVTSVNTICLHSTSVPVNTINPVNLFMTLNFFSAILLLFKLLMKIIVELQRDSNPHQTRTNGKFYQLNYAVLYVISYMAEKKLHELVVPSVISAEVFISSRTTCKHFTIFELLKIVETSSYALRLNVESVEVDRRTTIAA